MSLADARRLPVVGVVSVTVLGVVIGLYTFGGVSDPARESKRGLADAIISVFEHDTPVIQYGYLDDRNDGRGFSAGRGSFSTAGGELLSVIEDYSAHVPANPLTPYLAALRALASAGGSSSHTGLDGFATSWVAASSDQQLRAVQDRAMDRLFYQPALAYAGELGLRSPLGIVALYDTAVQHGTGEGPDSLGEIVKRATAAAHGAPADGVHERAWLDAFLTARRGVLLQPQQTQRRTAWSRTTGRVEAMSLLLKTGNEALRAPLSLSPYGRPHLVAEGGHGADQAVASESSPDPANYVVWLPDGTPSPAALTPSPTPVLGTPTPPPSRPTPKPSNPPAPKPTAGPRVGTITGAGGLCVDVQWSVTDDGTPIHGWPCNGSLAEEWTIVQDGTIRALSKCMQASDVGPGDTWRVMLWACDGTSEQHWRVGPDESLVNEANDLCLHYPQALTDPGAQLRLADCDGTNAQRWTMPR